MNSLTGLTIDHFTIKTLLRSDHAFAVYQAQDVKSGSEVLLWVAFPDASTLTEVFTQRFLERLNLLSLLEHSNLLPVMEFGQSQGIIYWVTPDVKGQLLSEVLSQPRSEKEAARIAECAAAALEYLHQQDVSHGGLSPEYILLGPEGEVYLFNYGMAIFMNAEIREMTPEGMFGFGISSPAYQAPEQITHREISAAADIYALGALYFALLIGRGPRETGALAETALKQVADAPAWPKNLPVKVSQTSVRLIHKCLSTRPDDRFKKAGEARKILENLARGKGAWIRLKKAQLAGAPGPSPLPLLLALFAVILILTVGVIVWRNSLPQGWSSVFPQSDRSVAVEPASVTAAPTVLPTEPPAATKPLPDSTLPPTNTPAVGPTAAPTTVENPTPTAEPAQPTAPGETAIQPLLVDSPLKGSPELIQASNVAQVREILRLGFGKFNQVAQSPDGQAIAVASTAGVFILGQGGGIEVFIDPQDEASSVTFSPYDGTLAVGLRQGDIQIWNWKEHQLVKTLKGHTGRISRMLYSPNKRNLISASYDLYIIVWDVASGTEFKKVKAHPQPIRDIALTSGDARYLASVSDDQRVLLWDISTLRNPIEFIHPAPSAVAFSEDGQILAIGGRNGEIDQWNITARQLRSGVDPIFENRAITGMVYDDSAASTLRVTLDDSSVITVNALQKASGSGFHPEIPTTPKELYDKLGNSFEFVANAAIQPGSTGAAVLWDGTLRSDSTFKFPSPTKFEDFKKLYFSPDSRYLLAAGPLSNVYLWNVADNRLGGTKTADIAVGNPFSQDSSMIAMTERSRITSKNPAESGIIVDTVSIFSGTDLTKLQNLSSVPLGSSIQFTLDDSLLIAGTATRTKYWDIKSGLETYVSEGNDSGCQVAKSANDGAILSIYSPLGLMTAWDDRTRLLCNLSDGFSGRLAYFTPDRKFLIYENANGLLELRDIEKNSKLWTMSFGRDIAAVAFSPDDSLITLGSLDGTLTFVETQTHTVLRAIQAHPGAIRSVTFSPDGKRIATGSADGTVRVWEVLPGFGQ